MIMTEWVKLGKNDEYEMCMNESSGEQGSFI